MQVSASVPIVTKTRAKNGTLEKNSLNIIRNKNIQMPPQNMPNSTNSSSFYCSALTSCANTECNKVLSLRMGKF